MLNKIEMWMETPRGKQKITTTPAEVRKVLYVLNKAGLYPCEIDTEDIGDFCPMLDDQVIETIFGDD